MQSTIEKTDDHVVRLSAEVEPDEFAKDLARTYRTLAGQVKIPGFRKRKVPRLLSPAGEGDYVLADVRAYVNNRDIAEATRPGFLSEVGSEELVPELDKELEGKRKGDILKFNAVLPEKFGPELAGQEVAFQVLVKEVKAMRLPAADDEFAKTASEFDTLEQLREDVRTKLRSLKEAESRAAVRDLVLSRVVDSVDIALPERLVDEETERRIKGAEDRATR